MKGGRGDLTHTVPDIVPSTHYTEKKGLWVRRIRRERVEHHWLIDEILS